jgi:mechanosensitive ion channel-like protein
MQATTAVPIRDVGEAVRASLAGALSTLLLAIPRILAFAIVLIIGWLIASLIARGTIAVLRAIHFNDLARRSGFAGFVQNMGVKQDATGVIASVAKWFVRLMTLVVAFDTLGLPAVSGVLQQLLLWLPNLAVGLVVLVIGGLAANALSRLVRGSAAGAGLTNPDLLAAVTKIAVWSFAVVVAVSQLGIATTLINTLVVGVVGAIALATGLAFGLGGRDRAAQLLGRMGEVGRQDRLGLERPTASAVGASAPATAPRAVAFEEGWTPRSGVDRRRIARPGPDRREAGGMLR